MCARDARDPREGVASLWRAGSLIPAHAAPQPAQLPMKGSSANSIFYEVFSFNIWTFIAHVIKLAGDVTYGLQKELFKFLLVTLAGAVFAEIRTALSAPKLPVLPPSNLAEWQQARLTARELLQQALARRRVRHAIAVVLGLWIAGCSVSTLMPLSPPLPPPPPPPPLLLVVRRAGASRAVQAVRYCRAHRVELVLVMSSLLLADWLNVLATPWVEKKAGECRGLSGAGHALFRRNIPNEQASLLSPRYRSIDSTPLCASRKARSDRQRA